MRLTRRQLRRIILKEINLFESESIIDQIFLKFPDNKAAIELAHAGIDVAFAGKELTTAGAGMFSDFTGIKVPVDDIEKSVSDILLGLVLNHIPENMRPGGATEVLKEQCKAAAKDKKKAKEMAATLIVLGSLLKGPVKEKLKKITNDLKQGKLPKQEDILKIPLGN